MSEKASWKLEAGNEWVARDPFGAGGHLPWAATAAALILAAALVCLAAVRSARAPLGPDVAVGASLTAVQTRAGSVQALPLHPPLPRSGAPGGRAGRGRP